METSLFRSRTMTCRTVPSACRPGIIRRRPKGAGGFTLIELLLVVVIIGILAALVIPKMAGRSEEARKAAAQQDIATLAGSLSVYEVDLGRYPATEEGLDALIQPPSGLKDPAKWKGPYIQKKEIPIDPWGNPYKYVYPGARGPKTFDLSSAGPDGQEGTEDDIAH
jgi:general secretion pathway protein G